jgi:hypothetical protein
VMWRLKVGKDDKETTCCGRLFQIHGATTGNVRSPMVDKRVLGTTSMAVDQTAQSSSGFDVGDTMEIIGEIWRRHSVQATET